MKVSLATGLFLAFFAPATAHAVCGDVTGDNKVLVTDALAVLNAATGQPVPLTCAGDGPSQLRYYNDFTCSSGTSLSTAMFNSFEFTADGGETSEYQEVDRTQIDTILINICGIDFTFDGPLNLPPERFITFFVSLLDPDIYGFANIPALITLTDDGLPPALGALDPSGQLPSNTQGYVLGGHGLRTK